MKFPRISNHQDIHIITETHTVYGQVDSHMTDDVVCPTYHRSAKHLYHSQKFNIHCANKKTPASLRTHTHTHTNLVHVNIIVYSSTAASS